MSEVTHSPEDVKPENSWFREEYERAKKRNALIPPWARMVITNPIISAHRRRTTTTKEN